MSWWPHRFARPEVFCETCTSCCSGPLRLYLLMAALGGYWISRRALAPVDEITQAARSIGIQNLSRRLTVPATGDELQRLSETWNDMLARLESAVKRLSQFTADASHELRTPIALIRTTAELTLRRDRSPETVSRGSERNRDGIGKD